MFLLWSQHCFAYQRVQVQAMRALERAEKANPNFEQSFTIFLLHKCHDESADVEQKDILSYIAWQKHMADARAEVRLRIPFWSFDHCTARIDC